jgi:hypothetical protein
MLNKCLFAWKNEIYMLICSSLIFYNEWEKEKDNFLVLCV